MPQFDPTTFSPQIIWLVITFAMLYLAMSRLALPRISQVLEERQHKIDENLKKAAALQSDAHAAQEAYEAGLTQARGEAQEVLRRAREKMSEEAAERQEDLGKRLDGEIRAAEERIGDSKNKALAQIREVAVEVAAAAASKLAGEKLGGKAAAAAVDAAMKDSS